MYKASALSEAASEKLTLPKKATIEKLISILKELVAAEPYYFDGSTWAIVNRKSVCNQLSISHDLFAKIIKHDMFVYDVVKINGVISTLLRLGPKGPLTARTAAKGMAKVWRSEIKTFNQAKHKRELEAVAEYEMKASEFAKNEDSASAMSHKLLAEKHSAKAAKAEEDGKKYRKETPAEFGCFNGLAEIWGPDVAVKLWVYVIRNWSRFMVQLKFDNLFNDDVDEKLGGRYYEFPSAAVVRKVWWIAFDLALHDFQEGSTKADLSLQQTMLKVVDGKLLAVSPNKKMVIDLVCSPKSHH
jgi:hypothetical protein